MRKLLVLAKYGRRAASTRYRFTQYFPALEAAGFQAEVSPLLDDDYLGARFAGRIPLQPLLRAGARRWRDLLRAGDFDAVLLNYEAFPYLPAIFESLLATRAPVVLDIDDAIFHRYDLNPWLRPLLGGKIRRVASLCRVAIAGNEYLADHLRPAQPDVRVIPTVVDTSLYLPAGQSLTEVPVIGWIGSPSTAEYLRAVLPALREVADGRTARLVFVGAGARSGIEGAELRDWAESREIADVQGFDIGIMPLPDDPWSRGKCGFKLVQYMACGLPVVASPVGVNPGIVGKAGLLASSPEEWKQALLKLLGNPALRQELGAAARERAVAEYSLQRWSPAFVRSVTDAARN
jgi:glycosyltransferase involved in cell wall biosynthesis